MQRNQSFFLMDFRGGWLKVDNLVKYKQNRETMIGTQPHCTNKSHRKILFLFLLKTLASFPIVIRNISV
jgi:hypothetical protein